MVVLPSVTSTQTVHLDSLLSFILTDSVVFTTVLTDNHVQTFGILVLFFLFLEELQPLEVTFFHGDREAFGVPLLSPTFFLPSPVLVLLSSSFFGVVFRLIILPLTASFHFTIFSHSSLRLEHSFTSFFFTKMVQTTHSGLLLFTTVFLSTHIFTLRTFLVSSFLFFSSLLLLFMLQIDLGTLTITLKLTH